MEFEESIIFGLDAARTRYTLTYCVWRPLPANIRMYLIFLETTIIGLHFAADNIGLSSLKFLCSVNFCSFPQKWRQVAAS